MIEQSLRIGTFAGIPVKIHWSFLFLFVYILGSGLMAGTSLDLIVVEMVFMLCMFVCVVLHEFGHALTARRYNIKTEDIILLPIGGVARLRNMPEKPSQELWVALMGPVVNLVIAIVILIYLMLRYGTAILAPDLEVQESFLTWQNFIPTLMVANIFLMIFNLIPAFPMDGGRVLRALLAMRLGRLSATKWASRIGQFICLLLIGYGIYQEAWVMVFIGIFIFMSAMQEYKSVAIDDVAKNKTIGMMARKVNVYLPDYQTLQECMDLVIRNGLANYLVMDLEGNYCGTVSTYKIVKLHKQNPELRIKDIYHPQLIYMKPSTPLLEAMQTIRGGQPVILIQEEEGGPSYIDGEVIERYMMLEGRT